MHRLQTQIYLHFVGICLLAVFLAGMVLKAVDQDPRESPMLPALQEAGRILVAGLPEEASQRAQTLKERGDRLHLDLQLWEEGSPLLAEGSSKLPKPFAPLTSPQWFHREKRWGVFLPVEPGKFLVAAPRREFHRSWGIRPLLLLCTVALAIALGSHPLSRRLTRRLESLQGAVEEWGRGSLSKRVTVRGRDEVAQLAESFNRAAGRIEALVEGQKRMLASASHELRSPLARVRLALELLEGEDSAGSLTPQRRTSLVTQVEEDIAELDELIGDLLLSSRLQSQEPLAGAQPVAISTLAREEGTRVGAETTGEEIEILGDSRMLRRMMRNLLENAVRHGKGEEVSVRVEALPGGGARVEVSDRGPGVAEGERERIFEPFYRPPGHREGADGGVGLGLALVRQIARGHGGEAFCLPREGGGTRFVVEIRGVGRPGP